MRMVDIIRKKRDGNALSREEIGFFVEGCTDGSIPDYQLSALMMAIYFSGMTAGETALLTDAMARSGETVDLSPIAGVKVDKHSTGGVGDKTTLIAGPIAAACGVRVAKMSGRGLGHTGGTVDKLESIPGFEISLPRDKFLELVGSVGICVAGQTANLAPADKKLYSLRDVTATVESLPLIAASIMSKKLASGADRILLDVKVGSGAFMKTPAEAEALAAQMIEIGECSGRPTAALITNMDIPLGNAIGNALEVAESVRTLRGEGPADLTALCTELAAEMIRLASGECLERCREKAKSVLSDGAALSKFEEMVRAQGGDVSVIRDTRLLPCSEFRGELCADRDGFIGKMDVEGCGTASVLLGAGRETTGSAIDYGAGIILHAKTGDTVAKGDTIAELFAPDPIKLRAGTEKLRNSVTVGRARPEPQPLIYSRITAAGGEDNI